MAAPCIVFFDEIDGLMAKRGTNADSEVSDRVVSQFLAELDGIEELKGVVVLAATNKLDRIDSAMLRAGRFDFLLEVTLPPEEDRHAILRIHTADKPIDRTVSLENLAKFTEGFSGADIESICKGAALAAIRENLTQGQNKNGGDFKITARHFTESLNECQARRATQLANGGVSEIPREQIE
jgi:transitional endoplasmic reticulum ATPase